MMFSVGEFFSAKNFTTENFSAGVINVRLVRSILKRNVFMLSNRVWKYFTSKYFDDFDIQILIEQLRVRRR
jgi:hypothetical protein